MGNRQATTIQSYSLVLQNLMKQDAANIMKSQKEHLSISQNKTIQNESYPLCITFILLLYGTLHVKTPQTMHTNPRIIHKMFIIACKRSLKPTLWIKNSTC